MANDVMFEGKERRIAKIEQCLAEYGPVSYTHPTLPTIA